MTAFGLGLGAFLVAATPAGAHPVTLQASGPGRTMTLPDGQTVAVAVAIIQPYTKLTKVSDTITGLNNTTALYGEVEYNTTTCALISSGTWVVQTSKPPKHGTVSNGTATSTLTSGTCSGHSYTFGVVGYTWTTGKKATSDIFKANWTTPDAMFNLPFEFTLKLTP